MSAKAAIPQKRAIPEHPTTIVWRHGVPFTRVILLIVGVIIGDVHNHLTHPQPPKRLQRHQQLRHHLHLKANQANQVIVKGRVKARVKAREEGEGNESAGHRAVGELRSESEKSTQQL